MNEINKIEHEIQTALAQADNPEALEAARIAALGKKGSISELLKTLGKMSPEERQEKGALFNALKMRVQTAIEAKKTELEAQALAQRLATERVDITLPVRTGGLNSGRIHPISQVIDEVTAIFADMGFSIAEGPDIETDYYNFTALNFPEGHPAREMHDTFFMQSGAATAGGEAKAGEGKAEKRVLRTHTSPVQVRTMEKVKPPLRIIIPGKTYRMDSDATHSPMFHQLEGLVVDKSANIANMMWVLERFCRLFFEVPSVEMRFRPSYFPFTEPSMEVDIRCDRSGGAVKFGQGNDWLEILGCGMVHPNVLKAGGLDPEQYQGFAWGLGLDRIAMLKYGMNDLRAFFDADLRWSAHYGFRPLDIPGLVDGLSR